MQSFLENNPDVSVEEWTAMSPQEILAASGYNPVVVAESDDS
jgi:hypothetical protein